MYHQYQIYIVNNVDFAVRLEFFKSVPVLYKMHAIKVPNQSKFSQTHIVRRV